MLLHKVQETQCKMVLQRLGIVLEFFSPLCSFKDSRFKGRLSIQSLDLLVLFSAGFQGSDVTTPTDPSQANGWASTQHPLTQAHFLLFPYCSYQSSLILFVAVLSETHALDLKRRCGSSLSKQRSILCSYHAIRVPFSHALSDMTNICHVLFVWFPILSPG